MQLISEAELYRRAAALLRTDGWVQGRGRSGSRRCMAFAIIDIDGTGKRLAVPMLRTVIGESISAFNDTPGMTKRDVIAALEIAADLAS